MQRRGLWRLYIVVLVSRHFMEISSGCAQSSAPAAQIYQIISIKIGRSSFEKNRDFTFPSAVNSRLVLALALAALASDQSTFVRWRLTRSCRSDLQYLQTKRAQARNDTIIPPSLQRIIVRCFISILCAASEQGILDVEADLRIV